MAATTVVSLFVGFLPKVVWNDVTTDIQNLDAPTYLPFITVFTSFPVWCGCFPGTAWDHWVSRRCTCEAAFLMTRFKNAEAGLKIDAQRRRKARLWVSPGLSYQPLKVLMQSWNFFQIMFHELPTSKEEGRLLLWFSRADISKKHSHHWERLFTKKIEIFIESPCFDAWWQTMIRMKYCQADHMWALETGQRYQNICYPGLLWHICHLECLSDEVGITPSNRSEWDYYRASTMGEM